MNTACICHDFPLSILVPHCGRIKPAEILALLSSDSGDAGGILWPGPLAPAQKALP